MGVGPRYVPEKLWEKAPRIAVLWLPWPNPKSLRIPDGVMRSGLPNPFAWWLYLPAYILSVVYFAVRHKQIVSKSKQRLSTVD